MTFQPNDIVEVTDCGCVGIVTRADEDYCNFRLIAIGAGCRARYGVEDACRSTKLRLLSHAEVAS